MDREFLLESSGDNMHAINPHIQKLGIIDASEVEEHMMVYALHIEQR